MEDISGFEQQASLTVESNTIDADNPENSGDDFIVAIDYKNGKVGCAFYQTESNKLSVMEDIQETEPFDIIDTCKQYDDEFY